MSSRNQVSIAGIFGASGSGKSTLQKLELLDVQPQRLAIWDPKREYRRFGVSVETLEDLARAVRRVGPFRVVFHPLRTRKAMKKQFDTFCTIVDRLGDPELGGTPLMCVTDDLADVTEPGWAPEGWERLTRQGRHAGLTIRALSQSPMEIDKTFYRNISHLAVFRLNGDSDITRMSKILGLPEPTLRALQPLEWIQKDMLTGAVSDKKKLTPEQFATLPP